MCKIQGLRFSHIFLYACVRDAIKSSMTCLPLLHSVEAAASVKLAKLEGPHRHKHGGRKCVWWAAMKAKS